MVRGDHSKNTPSAESRDPLHDGSIVCSFAEDYRAARVLAATTPDDVVVEDVMEVLAAAGILQRAVMGHKARKRNSDMVGPLRKITIKAG